MTPHPEGYDDFDLQVAYALAERHGTHYTDELRNRRPEFAGAAERLRKADRAWISNIERLIEATRRADAKA